MLCDPARTGVVAVARPEEMPVNETLALDASLRAELGLGVDLVVANAMLPGRFTAADARALEGADDGPELRAARHAHARAQAQQSQLRRLRRAARGPVATLPFVFGDARVERLSRTLERLL
jgi:hypothetical protein